MVILYLIWMFLKLARGKIVISSCSSSCLDVLKIRMKMRGNDLNRQIYPFNQHSLFSTFSFLIQITKTNKVKISNSILT